MNCQNCGRPSAKKVSGRRLCGDCAMQEAIEYWPEGNTVIDRDGKVVMGIFRADAIRNEQQARKAADMLNAGKTVEQVRASR
jgi:hypothetical protein